jgi:hypothetical protein
MTLLCVVAWYTSQRPLPWFFATYIAMSALRSSSSVAASPSWPFA